MAAFVKSVEHFTHSYGTTAGVTSNTVNLTKGQDETKCVPFYTAHTTGSGTNLRNNDFFACEMIDNSGTPAVKIHRNAATTVSDKDLSVYVVEFGSNVTVQQGSVDITGITVSDTITAIVEANSFAVFSQFISGSQQSALFGEAMVRCFFGSTTSIDFDRELSNNIDWTIHWYVVESDGTDFLTEYVEDSWTGSETGPTNLTLSNAITLEDAFVINSHTSSDHQSLYLT